MDEIERLVSDFRTNEGPDRRGPCFKRLALGIEAVMRAAGVSQSQLLEWLGPPDLFDRQNQDVTYIYRFDHDEPGRDGDEWYLYFADGRLIQSGYNAVGINDLSGMRPRDELLDGNCS